MNIIKRGPGQGLPKVPDGQAWVVPLGGVGRIGLNWTLYGTAKGWLLVDAGIGFPDAKSGEGDFLMPLPEWVKGISQSVQGLILTHAHEDHIGTVHRLWPEFINCPIWATPYCAGILASRLIEAGTQDQTEIRQFNPGDGWDLAGFSIMTIPVSHSAPEAVALVLKGGGRCIVHTGDWKDDATPLVGLPTDWDMLEAVGKQGVDLLVCDSTNADSETGLTSEMEVLAGFSKVMESRQGMVVVACFGSNVSRITAAVMAAGGAGRQAALMGRSARTSEAVARRLGMMGKSPEFLYKPSHLRALDRRETALVCTGTQGEENAVLWRLARGEVSYPTLEPGDTVIISSRAIPSRREGVDTLVAALQAMDVEVLLGGIAREGGHRLHVTGHAGREEIARMHSVINPRHVLPVHGEAVHLDAHGAIASSAGRPFTVAREGDLIQVGRDGVTMGSRLDARVAIFSR